MKYCQEETCKFVFPYYHPEQETRANIHTRIFTQLARFLNRTIVLTNVGNSRVQACFPYPFDFYYDIKAFQKQYPDIRFITQEKFFKWTQERKIKPIAQHSRMIQDDKFDLNITDYKEFHTGIKIKELNHKAMLNLVTNTLKTPPITESEVIMILNTSPKEIYSLENGAILMPQCAKRLVKETDSHNSKYEKEFKGSGIHGILDKLVCINAKYFLKGPKGCARTSSTFTSIIVNERTKLKKNDLMNIAS
ncbi:7975_t:CDS:2, partial [Gigaspora margarita]